MTRSDPTLCPGPTPCPADAASGGYHLYPDLGLFDMINPKTGMNVQHGTPVELAFTPLDARGSAVLRYRTGDYIGLWHLPPLRTHPAGLNWKYLAQFGIKSMQLDKIIGGDTFASICGAT